MSASLFARFVREEDGVLSFEWTLLVVLLVVGIVSGVAAGRDVIIDELGDTAEAVLAFDQSYSFAGIPGVIGPSTYTDTPVVFGECDRNNGADAPAPIDDFLNGTDPG
jgi:Flp pilus assembly pilin Flp